MDEENKKAKEFILIDFYNKLSQNYLELYGEEQKEKWIYVLELITKALNNQKIEVIIDLGCGIGIINLKDSLKNTKSNLNIPKILGIDISLNSLNIAKNKYDFLINSNLNNFCFKKINKKENLIISVSSLQNLNIETIMELLSLESKQVHSVMFKSKGEDYWINFFKEYGFRFYKKVRNDLIFLNF